MSTNPNMEAIQTITVSATSAANITFSNIPQTYTDLVLVLSGRTTQSSLADSIYFTFNSSTSNFSSTVIYNDGSSASMFNQARYAGSQPGSTATTSTFSNIEIYIPGYTNNRNKSYLVDSVSENNSTTGYIYSAAGLWSDTSAINSIVLTPNAGSFVQHSSATLYGVTAFVGETGGKAIGGTVTSDANYWYHTFTTSGMFTPTQNITADYLVVAGGAGAGYVYGAGGGAGGLRCTVTATGGGGSLESALSLTSGTNHTVLIGGGGSGSSSGSRGNNGSDSVFSTITSTGGGGGGSSGGTVSGITGGSGGGGAGGNNAASGGSGTANQGYAGGNGHNGGNQGSGGGGGGGAAGANGTSSAGGNGGNGVATSIGGSSVTYAGGGGGATFQGGTGGSGGTGGGGAAGTGGTDNPGTAGTANRGGGGGGTAYQSTLGIAGANGGSGIVIVRYAK